MIGITVKTINKDNQAAKDIGGLWAKFMSEGIQAKIPNKTSMDILAVYTDYEGDHTEPYTTFLGCRVSSLADIPEGLVGKEFKGGTCVKYVSKGDLTQGAVYQTWAEIWVAPLDRAYTYDFEVYGKKATNPKNAVVDIFISVKK